MGKDAVYKQIFHLINCGNVLNVLTADAEAVHTGIDGNVDMQADAALLHFFRVSIIRDSLGQPVAAKQ